MMGAKRAGQRQEGGRLLDVWTDVRGHYLVEKSPCPSWK